VGCAAAPVELLARIATVHQYVAVCAGSFAQHGAVAALREGEDFVRGLVAEYRARRDEVVAAAAGWPGTTLVAPRGAFYAFPRIELDGVDGSSLAIDLLEDAGVAAVPGAAFGSHATAHLRLSFAVAPDVLRDGLQRIAATLERLA
jgi:aspartate/methionine/tyrosine aminotransferase